MRIVREETLHAIGGFARSRIWRKVRKDLYAAVRAVVWPTGNDKFVIYPESGKKRGKGNGVTPIKEGLMLRLVDEGWNREERLEVVSGHRIGKFDAVLHTKYGPVVVEWETGNISSSHRAMNKMALALMNEKIAAGILVVPSRALYYYLTDRIGNFAELEPYLDIWRSVPIKSGVLEIAVVEHDDTSTEVPRIRKGTDGRALG